MPLTPPELRRQYLEWHSRTYRDATLSAFEIAVTHARYIEDHLSRYRFLFLVQERIGEPREWLITSNVLSTTAVVLAECRTAFGHATQSEEGRPEYLSPSREAFFRAVLRSLEGLVRLTIDEASTISAQEFWECAYFGSIGLIAAGSPSDLELSQEFVFSSDQAAVALSCCRLDVSLPIDDVLPAIYNHIDSTTEKYE